MRDGLRDPRIGRECIEALIRPGEQESEGNRLKSKAGAQMIAEAIGRLVSGGNG